MLACNGHISSTHERPEGGYHYHAGTTFPNLPTCLSGVVAKNNFLTNVKLGIGAQGGQGMPGPGQKASDSLMALPPGFDVEAKKLGVSESDLFRAVMNNGGRELDISAAAKELGVTAAALKSALPEPPGQ